MESSYPRVGLNSQGESKREMSGLWARVKVNVMHSSVLGSVLVQVLASARRCSVRLLGEFVEDSATPCMLVL